MLIWQAKEALAINPGDMELVETAHLRFRAAKTMGTPDFGPEHHEWLEVCEPNEIGDDGISAWPVYTIQTKSNTE